MTSLSKYANEIDAIARPLWETDKGLARKLDDIAYRMRRDASIKPNAKPFAVYGTPPISGGREVRVERGRGRG